MVGAQANHTSDAFMRYKIKNGIEFTDEEKEWMDTPYISILAVNNKEELEVVIEDAKAAGLSTFVWNDTIPSTVQKNAFIPDVMVGVSIGPDDFDKIKSVVGYLPRFTESMDTKTFSRGEM
jgi:hypothetical protein